MQRSLEDVERDLAQLQLQIAAAANGKSLNAADKRIILEGYAKTQERLLKEKAGMHTNLKRGVLNCKIGKATPIPNYLQRSFTA